MSPPFLMGAPFHSNGDRWTGWWTGDAYDAGTAIATGQPSAGPSSSRSTGPGQAPSTFSSGGIASGHTAIRSGGASTSPKQWLDTNSYLSDFVSRRRWLAYMVVRFYDGSFTSYTEASVFGGAALGSGAHFQIGQASFGGTDVLDTTVDIDASSSVLFRQNVTAGSILDHVILYEVLFDAGGEGFTSRINGAAPVNATLLGPGPWDEIPDLSLRPAQLFANYAIGMSRDEFALAADLWEFRITDRPPGPDRRTELRAGLMTKYGITP